MRRTALFIALLISPALAAAQPAQDLQFAADVDSIAARVMALRPAPGMAIAVVKDDRTILTKGYGFADIERNIPVTANTGFYIASTTKAFTALNVALMANRGEVSLDAPISRYLSDVRWASDVNPDSITVRDLLTHTHGISNSGPVVWRTAFSGVHTNDLLKGLLKHHTASEAGRTYSYTNLGYNIAGLIIDDIADMPWQEQLAKNIFAPLGMTSTSAFPSRYDSARLAMPYGAEPMGPQRLHYAKGDGNMQAAGGLISTANDLARWLEMQINLGLVDGRQVFPRAMVAETQKIQTMFEKPTSTGSIGYALGWNVALVNGDTVLHHGGGFSAFRTYIAFSPNSRIGVAVMANEARIGGGAIDFLIDQVLDYGREGWRAKSEDGLAQLAAGIQQRREGIAKDREARAARPQALPHPLATYTGTYDNAEAGAMVWSVRDGRLWAEIGLLKSVATAYDAAANKLRVELEPGSGEVIGFDVVDGKARSMTYSGRTFIRRSTP